MESVQHKINAAVNMVGMGTIVNSLHASEQIQQILMHAVVTVLATISMNVPAPTDMLVTSVILCITVMELLLQIRKCVLGEEPAQELMSARAQSDMQASHAKDFVHNVSRTTT